MSDAERNSLDGIPIAKAAGHAQFAISLLHQGLTQFFKKTFPDIMKFDFMQSLDFLWQNGDRLLPELGKSFKRQLDRAKKVRNKYSHQDFDILQFQHDMECLAKVASLIKCPEIEKQILSLACKEESFRSELEGDVPSGDWKLLEEKGNKHYRSMNWTEAMNCYTMAIRINPRVAVLFANRALCELKLSKIELAREDAEDAIELDPNQVSFYRILSEALFGLKLYNEAQCVCRSGLKIEPRDETLLLRLRDCGGFSIDQDIKEHPVYGGLKQLEDVEVFHNRLKQNFKDKVDVPAAEVSLLKPEQIKISFKLREAHRIIANGKGKIAEEQKAMKIFEMAAKQGSAEGQYNLAMFYHDGRAGIPKDIVKAKKLLHGAASQTPYYQHGDKCLPNVGVAEAENSIALMYREGRGYDRNEKLAFEWFLKSAQHGCPSAQNNLGRALDSGAGCSKNLESARWWFQKSADLGQAEAQLNLAIMLINGEGGPVDCQKAEHLLKSASDQGMPDALIALQNLLRSGARGVKSMNSSQKIIRDKAEENDKNAFFLLGFNYLNGSGGFQKNLKRAEENLKKSSTLGHPQSHFILANLLLEHAKNEDAFIFMEKSANLDSNHEAKKKLATLLLLGHGCKRDPELARRWLVRASRHLDIDIEGTMKFCEAIVEFETSEELKVEGLTVKHRMDRFLLGKCGEGRKELKSLMTFWENALENPPRPALTKLHVEKLPEIVKMAKEGSKTAIRYIAALTCLHDAVDQLENGFTTLAISSFISAHKLWDLLPFTMDMLEAFYAAALKDLEEKPEDAAALYVILRYQALMQYDIHQLVSLARRIVSLNPSEAEYHHMLGCVYGFQGDFVSSQRSIENALELEPRPEWLYSKASSMRLQDKHDPTEVISAYLEYIAASEKDARKIPEAYYCIGLEYAEMLNDMEKAAEFQKKGIWYPVAVIL